MTKNLIEKFTLKNEKFHFFSLIFLFLIITIPNGSTYIFNGLPWLNKFETILLIIVLPVFFILNINLLTYRLSQLLIILLLFLKILIIFSPKIGVGYKQYFNYEDLSEKKYIETYSSFWDKKYSAIQSFPWTKKRNFPIDWTIYSKINLDDEGNKILNNYLDFEKLSLLYEVDFYIRFKKDGNLKIVTNGTNNNSKFFIKKIDEQNIPETQLILNNASPKMGKGLYKIWGTVQFSGKNWSFDPKISYLGKKENFVSAFSEKAVLLNIEGNLDKKLIPFYLFIGNSFEILLIVLIIVLLLYSIYDIRKLKFEIKFLLISIIFFITSLIFASVVNMLLATVGRTDIFGSFGIILTVISLLSLILLANLFKLNIFLELSSNPMKYLFLIMGPTLLIFFYNRFASELEILTWWGAGEDWTVFQNYARQIVVDKEWLVAGEEVFLFRPGIRYFFAVMHILFGQSGFAQKMIEAWCVIGASFLMIGTMIKLSNLKFISITSGLILLVIFVGTNYRWLIGRGLTEYYAMFLIMICVYHFINLDLSKHKNIILLGLVGAIGCWLREDHVFVILALIFLASKQKDDENYFYRLFAFIKENLKPIFYYGSIVGCGFALIFIRNYFVGGATGLDHPNVGELGWKRDLFAIWYNMFFATLPADAKEISSFTGRLWDSFFNHVFRPNIAAIILIGGTIFSFAIIFLKKLRKYKINIGIPLTLLATLLPFFFVQNLGYPPRYTIYFLPFCVISFFTLINILIKKDLKLESQQKESQKINN